MPKKTAAPLPPDEQEDGLFDNGAPNAGNTELLDDMDEEFEVDVEEKEFFLDDQVLEILKIESEDPSEGKEWGYYRWTFRVVDKNLEFTYLTSKSPKAAWKIEDILAGIGVKGDGGKLRFTRADVVGKMFIAKGEARTPPNQSRPQQDFTKIRQLTPAQQEYYGALP